MLKTIAHLLRGFPAVRASTLAILFYGFSGAVTAPYQSLLGIQILGMSDYAYSIAGFVAALSNVLASILVGIIADRAHSFRLPMLLSCGLGVFGYGIIWALPSAWTFVLASIGPIACFHVVNMLIFANLQNHSGEMSREESRDAVTVVRMAISLAWVVVPGLIALILSGGASLLWAWAIAALLAGACLATILVMMPRDAGADTGAAMGAAAAVGLRPSALADVMAFLSPGVLGRLLGTALITSVLHVNATILPLITTALAHGTLGDVGFIVGMVAAIEVALMLVWAQLGRRFDQIALLGLATGFYALYLIWLAFAGSRWEIYAASVIGGIGAAAIVSQPVAYLLTVIRNRPGLSAALIAINLFAASGIGAGIFALGSAIGGYSCAALLSAGASLAGVALLIRLEGPRLYARAAAAKAEKGNHVPDHP
jgi:SET family sugar efflux transporter-like MFS transporter